MLISLALNHPATLVYTALIVVHFTRQTAPRAATLLQNCSRPSETEDILHIGSMGVSKDPLISGRNVIR